MVYVRHKICKIRSCLSPVSYTHLESEVTIAVDVNEGEDSATAWGCDLTYDYVKINGDYRT